MCIDINVYNINVYIRMWCFPTSLFAGRSVLLKQEPKKNAKSSGLRFASFLLRHSKNLQMPMPLVLSVKASEAALHQRIENVLPFITCTIS